MSALAPTTSLKLPAAPVPQTALTPRPPGGIAFPTTPAPLFKAEGPSQYAAALAHNAPFAKAGPYQTPLHPAQEAAFRLWVAKNGIPFDVNAKTADYNMRGFWLAAQNGQQAQAANGHFPDTFKTPYDTTFSGESQYAKPGTPFRWVGSTLVDTRTGQVVSK